MNEAYCAELLRWLCEEPERVAQEDAAYWYLGGLFENTFMPGEFPSAWEWAVKRYLAEFAAVPA